MRCVTIHCRLARTKLREQETSTYLKEKLSMTVTNCCGCTAVKSKALNCLLEIVELLREIQRANQHLVPSAACIQSQR
jgi:hypothetical protein